MMVKVLVHSYATGVLSSRETSRTLHEDIPPPEWPVIASKAHSAHLSGQSIKARSGEHMNRGAFERSGAVQHLLGWIRELPAWNGNDGWAVTFPFPPTREQQALEALPASWSE